MEININNAIRLELNSKINRLKREIKELEKQEEKYKKMNIKIEYIIPKIKNSERYGRESYGSFQENYSGEDSRNIINEFKKSIDNIEAIGKKFKNNILVESNNQISVINNKIQNKKIEVQELESQLMKIGG